MFTCGSRTGCLVGIVRFAVPPVPALSQKMFLVTPLSAPSAASVETDMSDCSTSSRDGQPLLEGSLRMTHVLECKSDVMCCQFNIDGQLLAVGLANGTIKIYSTTSATWLHNLSDPDTLKYHLPVTQIRFRIFSLEEKIENSHILIATYASGHVKFWHYTSGRCLHTLQENRQTLAIALDPSKTKFLTAGADALIHVYDLQKKIKLNTCEASDSKQLMDGHRFRIFTAQYHPSLLNIFISGGWDDTVQYWDDRKQHAIRRISGPHICGDALDIDPVHDHILTGSWRRKNVLQIWDFNTGRKITDVPENPLKSSMLYSAQWLGQDSIVCGGSNANMAEVINRGTLKVTGIIYNLPQAVYCIDNDHSSRNPRIAVGFSKIIYLMRKQNIMSDSS